MYKVEIIKNGKITHYGEFKTIEESIAWINDPKKEWGNGYVINGPINISDEISTRKAMNDRKKKRAFGENLIDKIGLINESKGITSTQVDEFMSVPIVATLREHLWAGNIPTFIEKLQASDVSMFFSQAEKDAVIAECQAFLASLGA